MGFFRAARDGAVASTPVGFASSMGLGGQATALDLTSSAAPVGNAIPAGLLSFPTAFHPTKFHPIVFIAQATDTGIRLTRLDQTWAIGGGT